MTFSMCECVVISGKVSWLAVLHTYYLSRKIIEMLVLTLHAIHNNVSISIFSLSISWFLCTVQVRFEGQWIISRAGWHTDDNTTRVSRIQWHDFSNKFSTVITKCIVNIVKSFKSWNTTSTTTDNEKLISCFMLFFCIQWMNGNFFIWLFLLTSLM